MKHEQSPIGAFPATGSIQVRIAHDAPRARRPRSDRSRILSNRSTSAAMALLLGTAVASLSGCGGSSRFDGPMDTLLLSDAVRYYLDGEMEVNRGQTDCYGRGCVITDGAITTIRVPEQYAFAGHHDEYISAHEDTIEDRNGILIGDVSFGEKELPDIPGFAYDRTSTGYGGWGKYHGFDALYYDYVRNDRPQRYVEASLGGYASRSNPVSGPLTWTGGAVGVDHSDITVDRVLAGSSKVTVELNEPYSEYLGRDEWLVRVHITDLADVASDDPYADMRFGPVPLYDGRFKNFQVHGQFFGPNHEEVGGVFQKDEITGAFGAIREAAQE